VLKYAAGNVARAEETGPKMGNINPDPFTTRLK